MSEPDADGQSKDDPAVYPRLLEVVVSKQTAELLHFPQSSPPFTPTLHGPNVSWNRVELLDEEGEPVSGGDPVYFMDVAAGADLGEEGPDGMEPFFTASAVVTIVASIPQDETDEDGEAKRVQAFVNRSATQIGYTYLRSALQHLAADAGLPRLTIPLIFLRPGEEPLIPDVVDEEAHDGVAIEVDGDEGGG